MVPNAPMTGEEGQWGQIYPIDNWKAIWMEVAGGKAIEDG